MAGIDGVRRTTSKIRNIVHSIILILAIGALTALCAYSVWGVTGVIWSMAGLLLLLIFAPRLTSDAIMTLFKAKPVDAYRGGRILGILEELAKRADLPVAPKLYVIPSPTLNAFATGTRSDPSIAVTEALLRRLSLREVAGVLAHEVAHIRNSDLWIMNLADVMSRFTRGMSFAGIFIFFLQLPLALAGKPMTPWTTIILLYFAPALSSLLQLGLSRAREYDADLEGAALTGDPDGLISALGKLERYQGRMWEDIVMPGRRIPQPSVLRSHPLTERRIARLKALTPDPDHRLQVPDAEAVALGLGVLPQRPRYHFSGYWY